jgi:phage recombination protein Bet
MTSASPSTSVAVRKDSARVEYASAARGGSDGAALALRAGQSSFDDQQRSALATLGIPQDAPQSDLDVFLHVSQRTGLDPFAKQIYLLYRRQNDRIYDRGQWRDNWVNKPSIQTGIDGFRVMRDRACERKGILAWLEETVWYDANGDGYGVWLQDDPPVAAKVVVVLSDGRRFPSVLKFSEYMQTDKGGKPAGKWLTAPSHQLEKCCEADGYRKAFPQDYSGVQLEDAMPLPDPDAPPVTQQPQRATAAEIRQRAPKPQQVTATVVDDAPPPDETDYDTPGTAVTKQLTAIWAALTTDYEFGKDEKDAAREACAAILGRPVESTKTLSHNEAGRVLAQLADWKRESGENGGSPRDWLNDAMTAAAAAADGEATSE